MARKGEVCKAVSAVTAFQVNAAKLGSGECTQTQPAAGPCGREDDDELPRKVGEQASHEPVLSCGRLQQKVGFSSGVSQGVRVPLLFLICKK